MPRLALGVRMMRLSDKLLVRAAFLLENENENKGWSKEAVPVSENSGSSGVPRGLSEFSNLRSVPATIHKTHNFLVIEGPTGKGAFV